MGTILLFYSFVVQVRHWTEALYAPQIQPD